MAQLRTEVRATPPRAQRLSLIQQRAEVGTFELLIDFQNEATTRPARRPAGELFSESLPAGLQVQDVQ